MDDLTREAAKHAEKQERVLTRAERQEELYDKLASIPLADLIPWLDTLDTFIDMIAEVGLPGTDSAQKARRIVETEGKAGSEARTEVQRDIAEIVRLVEAVRETDAT